MYTNRNGQRLPLLGSVQRNGTAAQALLLLRQNLNTTNYSPFDLNIYQRCRVKMNYRLTDDMYPNRFVDFHVDAKIGLSLFNVHSLDALGDANVIYHSVTLASGLVSNFVTFDLNPDTLSLLDIRIPINQTEITHSLFPNSYTDNENEDNYFDLHLIARHFRKMTKFPGFTCQTLPNMPPDAQFSPYARKINDQLSMTLPRDYDIYIRDQGLSGRLTLGQLIYWQVHTRIDRKGKPLRLVLTFLYQITMLHLTSEGSLVRKLLESFRLWLEGGCSSCFLRALLNLPEESAPSPFQMASVLDHPTKTYYIIPTHYRIESPPHVVSLTPRGAPHWLYVPMYEHSFIRFSGDSGTTKIASIRHQFSDSGSVELPEYIIINFDIIVTEVIRFVRAAKCGRFLPGVM